MTEHWDVEELPEEQEITINLKTGHLSTIIDNYILDNPDMELRKYIGASSIGHPCERKLWYGYQGITATPVAPSTRRTFDIGRVLERLVLDYLAAAGLPLVREPKQLSFKDKDVPQLQGNLDALWIKNESPTNPYAVIEIKTARDSSFNVFKRQGLQKWYPIYYSQVQTYMGLSNVKEAYIIAINKDTSELHDELVNFNEGHYQLIRSKALRIINATETPPKINVNPCYFVCRTCVYKSMCHA